MFHSIVVNTNYEPLHAVHQLERFTQNPDATVDPDHPQWQTISFDGGQKVTHKGKHKQDIEEPGVHAEVCLYLAFRAWLTRNR